MFFRPRTLKRSAFFIISLVVVLLLVLVGVHGTFLPKKYLVPWDKDYHKQFKDPRLQVIAHGILAPNSHNIQPWVIALNEEDVTKFDLFLDDSRLLEEADPYSRQLVISQGAFLEMVSISAKKLGFRAEISLFPLGELGLDPSREEIRQTPTATVELVRDKETDGGLYRYIFERVTTRTPYMDQPLTLGQIDRITSYNIDPLLHVLVFQDPDDLAYISEMATSGLKIESATSRVMEEASFVMRYSEYQKNRYRNGLTLGSQGWSSLRQFLVESFGTLFPVGWEKEGRIWLEAESERLQKTPAYVMIISDRNDRITQIKTGMLFARIQLGMTQEGLSIQPTLQVTQEYPEMREIFEALKDRFVTNGQTVQMLFRIGEAEKQVGHSPRKDVMEILRQGS